MSNRIFVGGLAWTTDERALREAFQAFGAVEDAHVATDRDSGRSRGFGFVTFVDGNDAQDAIRDMNGQTLDGRSLTVDLAQERGARGGAGARNNRSERRW